MTTPDPVITAQQAADEVGVHYQTLRRYVLSGELKAVKRGNRWFIRRSWLEAFLTPTRIDVA